jgi:carbonic anhydrase/acetyltransferase-like protein (isoleucine patch superfamily)
VVGHNAHIEGATVGEGCMIASGSVLLNGSVVEDGAVLGAGAVMSFNGHLPARRMALGVPARVREGHVVAPEMVSMIVENYVARIAVYRKGLRRLD